jgi:hypothetical protein
MSLQFERVRPRGNEGGRNFKEHNGKTQRTRTFADPQPRKLSGLGTERQNVRRLCRRRKILRNHLAQVTGSSPTACMQISQVSTLKSRRDCHVVRNIWLRSRRSSGLCDKCQRRSFEILQGIAAGTLYVVSAVGRLNFTMTQTSKSCSRDR